MTEALPPCPYRKRGQHRIAAILPGDDSHDVLLFCDACGTVSRQSVETPRPVDDWPDEAIREMVYERRRGMHGADDRRFAPKGSDDE